MTEITRKEVEEEMTRRLVAAFIEGITIEQAHEASCRIASEMAADPKYAPFFAELTRQQNNSYSVSCSEGSVPGSIAVDIELKGKLAELAQRAGPTHEWKDDHCVKCGDSDWYAGSICDEGKLKSQQPTSKPCVCPKCGAPEQEALTPHTVYFCGSRDYDQRPGTFKQSNQCAENEVRANRIKAEGKPNG